MQEPLHSWTGVLVMGMKSLCAAILFGLLITTLPCMAANNPATLPVTATIASLKLIPVSAAPLYPNIQVQDYYGTGSGCPIQYKWNPSDSTADNGGTIINPTGNAGNGRWNINLPPKSPVHTCVFGVKVDSTTNNATQLQAALTWAHNSGPNWVHIDGGGGRNNINFATTLNPFQGELITGDGMGDDTTAGNTLLNFTSASGWAFETLTPFPGFGLTSFESPKFRDLAITVGSSSNAGGCIRLNQIAGGFTDDNSSQQPMLNTELINITCQSGDIANNGRIGFQCSKCTEVMVKHIRFDGGLNGVDLEGVENGSIENCRITNTYDAAVKFVSHGTFGNLDTLSQCQLLAFQDHGQTIDSAVYDAARESSIANNFIEYFPASYTLTQFIHLAGGFSANVSNNAITGVPGGFPLTVDGPYNSVTVIGNQSNGTVQNGVTYNNGNYFFSSSGIGPVRQEIVHYGNSNNMDLGFPFNSHLASETPLPTNLVNVFTGNVQGLDAGGYGLSEKPQIGWFTFPNVTGSTNYLQFNSDEQGPPSKGLFDVFVIAYQSNASSGQISCTITDSGVPGSFTAQAVTGALKGYVIATAITASTDAGIRCYNSGSNGLILVEAGLIFH